MDENVRIRGIYTCVKFIMNTNYDTKNQNRIITKTLGKFGVVDTDYNGPTPDHDQFWLTKIVKEIKAGTPKGCIVLTPIMKLDRLWIKPLIPKTGLSTEYEENGISYVTPTNQSQYYIIPLDYRKSVKTCRVMICVNPGPTANPEYRMQAESLPVEASRNPYMPVNPVAVNSHGWDDASVRDYETR